MDSSLAGLQASRLAANAILATLSRLGLPTEAYFNPTSFRSVGSHLPERDRQSSNRRYGAYLTNDDTQSNDFMLKGGFNS